MKIENNSTKSYRGFTLPELTLSILILLSLIGITFAASSAYVRNSQEAGCIINQDKIHKVLLANAHLTQKPFQPGVDYCADPETKALFDGEAVCPEGGGYSAVLGADGKELVITCLKHGHTHK